MLDTTPGSVESGIAIAVLFNFGGFLLCLGLVAAGIGAMAVFGLVQFVWLFPLWKHCKNQGKTEEAKGVLLTAGLTFMLNAACWAAMVHP